MSTPPVNVSVQFSKRPFKYSLKGLADYLEVDFRHIMNFLDLPPELTGLLQSERYDVEMDVPGRPDALRFEFDLNEALILPFPSEGDEDEPVNVPQQIRQQ